MYSLIERHITRDYILYACMYVCILYMYIIYIYIYVCTYIHIYMFAHIYINLSYAYIHPSTCAYIHICLHPSLHTYRFMHVYICHTGVFSRTIKSLVCALGANSSMTKPTSNSTFYAFIEEVNFSYLQKMVLQFTICFVPIMVYTYMVYTLYNKAKHLA